jgi:hypothetical protein
LAQWPAEVFGPSAAGLPLLGDDRGHASLRALLEQGRQIITV